MTNKRITQLIKRIAKRRRTPNTLAVVSEATLPDGTPGFSLPDGRIVNDADMHKHFESKGFTGVILIVD